jgi:transcriptional regulator with XRE-family HTH domain
MATDFGKFLKQYMIKNDLTQGDAAKALNYSPSNFSNILTGKKSPDVEFLIRCQKYFKLDKKETIELFRQAFSSSDTITLDTSYFPPHEKDWIVDVLVTLVLFPKREFMTAEDLEFNKAVKIITSYLNIENIPSNILKT